jgi:hypothetical protein
MGNVAVKKPRKKKSKMYFGTPAQEAIIEYCASDNQKDKNKIFRKRLEYPFMKLAENLIHTYKFYYFDVDSVSVQKDVVGFMVMNMHKFNPDKGRAFSYFSIVAKNWLILNNNNNYKRYKQHTKLDSTAAMHFLSEKSDHRRQEQTEDANEFTEYLIQYMDTHLTSMFKKKRDIQIADSVMELFRRREMIENFNKKALYVLIREMTGYNTQHITKVINIMKKKYRLLAQEYCRTGMVTI